MIIFSDSSSEHKWGGQSSVDLPQRSGNTVEYREARLI